MRVYERKVESQGVGLACRHWPRVREEDRRAALRQVEVARRGDGPTLLNIRAAAASREYLLLFCLFLFTFNANLASIDQRPK